MVILSNEYYFFRCCRIGILNKAKNQYLTALPSLRNICYEKPVFKKKLQYIAIFLKIET